LGWHRYAPDTGTTYDVWLGWHLPRDGKFWGNAVIHGWRLLADGGTLGKGHITEVTSDSLVKTVMIRLA